jgi:hypothetical protein
VRTETTKDIRFRFRFHFQTTLYERLQLSMKNGHQNEPAARKVMRSVDKTLNLDPWNAAIAPAAAGGAEKEEKGESRSQL